VGELPPLGISPRALQQQQQPLPTISELRAALNLHRLSRAIAKCMCHDDLKYPQDRPGRSPPEDPARMPEWTARVSLAMFRLLTVGAALAGAYKEPLLRALEHPDPDIQALAQRVPADYTRASPKGESGLGQKDMAFLLQFAVCDLEVTLEAQDAVFGPVADWLLDAILSDRDARREMEDRFEKGYGRAGYCRLREVVAEEGEYEPCPLKIVAEGRGDTSHADAHLVVWELMKMFWLVDLVRPYSLSGGNLDRRAARPLSGQDVGAAPYGDRELQSAVVVFFGMFQAEEVLLPARLTDYPLRLLTAYPAMPETRSGREDAEEEEKERTGSGGKLPKSMSVAVFFNALFNLSGRLNHIGIYHPVAPLELKFFEYFLQRQLGICLDGNVFREDTPDFMSWTYQEFTETIGIFSHDDVENRDSYDTWRNLVEADFLDGSEILTKYPPDYERDKYYQQKQSYIP